MWPLMGLLANQAGILRVGLQSFFLYFEEDWKSERNV